MTENNLEQLGLTKEEAKIYEALLTHGPQTAGFLCKQTSIKRGLVYKTLERLTRKGLVESGEEAVAIFSPKHPLELKKLLDKQKKEIEAAEQAYKSTVNRLISQYNQRLERPGVSFYEGLEGMEEVYNDIIQTGQKSYLLRSGFESKFNNSLPPIIKRFMKKKVAAQLTTSAISPNDELNRRVETPAYDAANLIERKTIPKEDYTGTVEINVYGSKTAFLSLGNELVSVVIESPQIAEAMKQILGIVAKNKSQS